MASSMLWVSFPVRRVPSSHERRSDGCGCETEGLLELGEARHSRQHSVRGGGAGRSATRIVELGDC